MKKYFNYFALLLFSAVVFTACTTVEIPEDPFPSELVKGCYVINSGVFGKGGASISKFDYDTNEMTHFYYRNQNNGTELLSLIPYANVYNDSVFLIGNAVDQLITVNPLFEQSKNGLTGELENPRFFVGDGDYLYISCWGANPDYADMPDSYIAKYNIVTNQVVSKIMVPGGPEGLALVNGKLYAALNYQTGIAVIDLASGNIAEIPTPAVTSYFKKDKSNNLYVTLVSTWADFSAETGIGYVNTSTNELEATYPLANISSGYGSVIDANADFSKVYVVASSYDADWNLTGSVAEFDVASKSFSQEPLVSNVAGLSGLNVNPYDNSIYLFSATSATSPGTMGVYSPSGDLQNEYSVGAYPVGAFFLE